jgi:hypothetical protein
VDTGDCGVGHDAWTSTSALVFASELETIAICDVHERCIVASCCIFGMERVCFAMSVFAYSMCSECCITLDNK